MPRFLCRLLVAGIVLVSGAQALRAEEPPLRWRFEKGQSFKYLLKHREVRKTEVGTLHSEITTTSEYEWEFKVQHVDDKGVAALEKKLTALKVSIVSKDFDFAYDSSQPQRSDDDYKKRLITFYDRSFEGDHFSPAGHHCGRPGRASSRCTLLDWLVAARPVDGGQFVPAARVAGAATTCAVRTIAVWNLPLSLSEYFRSLAASGQWLHVMKRPRKH